jgi:hypothetical protein
MATKPASKTSSGASKASAARKPGQSSPPTGSPRGSETGERDETYNLVSVLYHALQGAETISAYIRDAEGVEDEELVEFFEETRTEYVARAAQAKRLLAVRLEDEIDEEEDELFADKEEGDEEEDEEEEED